MDFMLTISLILLSQWQYLSHLFLKLSSICVADTAFLCKLGGEGMLTNNMILWWPIFIIVLFVIVLWRELNCVKTSQCDANKSANRLEIYAPKVE
jgi:hypothetical protein